MASTQKSPSDLSLEGAVIEKTQTDLSNVDLTGEFNRSKKADSLAWRNNQSRLRAHFKYTPTKKQKTSNFTKSSFF